jgi:hypothetical protein
MLVYFTYFRILIFQCLDHVQSKNCLAHEDGTDSFSRNVGNKQPNYAA